jgi:RNA polymerase sigma-70 factor (ECF subfamily)
MHQTQRAMPISPSNRQEEGGRQADADLVARCLTGDMDAFQELYTRHATRLYNLAYRMSGAPADADELLQDIFLLAFRKLHSFKGDSSIGTWLYRLAVNLCLDHLRSRQGRMNRVTASFEEDAQDPAVVPKGTTGEVFVSRLDLERAIAQLPESYRAAFLLHDVEGFEHREVGEMLGIAEGTSKSLVHKARFRLRTLLGGSH